MRIGSRIFKVTSVCKKNKFWREITYLILTKHFPYMHRYSYENFKFRGPNLNTMWMIVKTQLGLFATAGIQI